MSRLDLIPDATRSLAGLTLAKALPATRSMARELYLAGHLRSIDVQGLEVRATVASSRQTKSYTVRGTPALLRCTCSSLFDCKHGAVVLLALANERQPSTEMPAVSGAEPTEDGSLSPSVARWLNRLDPHAVAPTDGRVAFLLEVGSRGAFVNVATQARVPGGWGRPELVSPPQIPKLAAGREPPEGLEWIDLLQHADRGPTKLFGKAGHFVLTELIGSERLFSMDGVVLAPLVTGPALKAELGWRELGGSVKPIVQLDEPEAKALATIPPTYVNPEKGTVGPIDMVGPPDRIAQWLSAPVIHQDLVARVVASLPEGLPAPRVRPVRVVTGKPRGVLTLFEGPPQAGSSHRTRHASLAFLYGGHAVADGAALSDGVTVLDTPDEQLRVRRILEIEEQITIAVLDAGFDRTCGSFEAVQPARWTLPDESQWIDFVVQGATDLRAAGIAVEIDKSFRLEVLDVDEFDASLENGSGTDWFELDVGVRVGDTRIDLVPILLAALRAEHAPLPGKSLYVPLPNGAVGRVPYDRVAPLVEVLLDLVSVEPNGKVKLSRLRAMDLAEGLALEGEVAKGLRSLRRTLTRTKKLPAAVVPTELKVKLRGYQREGFRWLAFLGEHGLGAVLADDMGLGKTLQLIALIALRRKVPGSPPSLVVAPTSVILSWVEQLEKFAPHLMVLRWHGKERHKELERLPQVDLVLTSYTLLHRDLAILKSSAWDVLVLDEAQAIKNPRAVAGDAARSLDARQRIAVTGTPLENHLGELWSILSFAVPGALGSEQAFKAAFRLPIEKHGNPERLAMLRRRISPLLLRRTKEDVAAELPPKTLIEVPIELEDAQRDLYEIVRRSVDKRVREEIQRRGLALSKIIILDALLKLRQVCCDPALLKLATPRPDVGSAKREAFRDLIETLVGEGRKVLVFSQFVEMLDLLASDLRALGIYFSCLTGATVDRAKQVRQFQSGDVPVFLISLKAGGVGLNLTAADTVIHYDPWWNPAVEAQATDRAHRIGQTKPVFVHRLITKGTVEEKIVAMQEKKADLARALLEGGGKALELDEAAIEDLLAPIPRG